MPLGEISNIILLEGYVPNQDAWSTTIQYIKGTFLNQVIAIFKGCDLLCSIESEDEMCVIPLSSGASEKITIENDGNDQELTIELEAIDITKDPLITYFGISMINMIPTAIAESDIKLAYYPKRPGFTITFDFTYALVVASGIEKYQSKEVQIKYADGTIVTVKKSTSNFLWIRDKLYCNLPSGQTCAMRFRYSTKNDTLDWCNWLSFTPKRKMTL